MATNFSSTSYANVFKKKMEPEVLTDRFVGSGRQLYKKNLSHILWRHVRFLWAKECLMLTILCASSYPISFSCVRSRGCSYCFFVRGGRDSTAVADVQSELESSAPELLPLWLRHGKQLPQELAVKLNLGGVRNVYKTIHINLAKVKYLLVVP